MTRPNSEVLLIPAPSVGPTGRLRRYLPLGLLSLRALSRPRGARAALWQPGTELCEPRYASSAELADAVVAALPRLDEYRAVGLATMCSSLHHTLRVAREIKRRAPGMPVWLGGHQASAVPAGLLDAFPDAIDAIFVGEGEASFGEVLDRVAGGDADLDGVAGLMTRGGDFTPRAPVADLDELPYIDLEEADLAVLREGVAGQGVEPAAPLELARGCPGRCTFCSTRRFWGRRVRHKSFDRIIDEARRYRRDTGLKRFEIMGDNLSASLAWLRKLCRAILAEAPWMRWQCDLKLGRLRPSDLDLLWRAGCRGFFVGIESGSQATLDRIRKEVDLEQELELLELALDQGFEIKASLIAGFPWEGPEDLDRTFTLHCRMLKLGVAQSQIWLLCPLPGTELLAEHEPRFDRLGSRLAMDGIPLDDETRDLARRLPDLFVQLGRYDTPALSPRALDATVSTASQLNQLHQRTKSA